MLQFDLYVLRRSSFMISEHLFKNPYSKKQYIRDGDLCQYEKI